MNIEKGDYVRTKDGFIEKVRKVVCKNYPIKGLAGSIICDDEIGTIIEQEKILKHSKNIIDLIEEGDYVNGMLVRKGKVASGEEKLLIGNYIIHGMALEVVNINNRTI